MTHVGIAERAYGHTVVQCLPNCFLMRPHFATLALYWTMGNDGLSENWPKCAHTYPNLPNVLGLPPFSMKCQLCTSLAIYWESALQ